MLEGKSVCHLLDLKKYEEIVIEKAKQIGKILAFFR